MLLSVSMAFTAASACNLPCTLASIAAAAISAVSSNTVVTADAAAVTTFHDYSKPLSWVGG